METYFWIEIFIFSNFISIWKFSMYCRYDNNK
jgi:hypothetical protein